MLLDLEDRGHDIVHVAALAQQEALGEPERLLAAGPFGLGAVYGPIIDAGAGHGEAVHQAARRILEDGVLIDRAEIAAADRDALGLQGFDEALTWQSAKALARVAGDIDVVSVA